MLKSNHNKRVDIIALELGITKEEVNKIINLSYECVRVKLDSVKPDDSKVYSEEEFKKVFKSVLLPGIGTFVPSYKKYSNIKKNINK